VLPVRLDVEAAKFHRVVVLTGGEDSLFGRGGEDRQNVDPVEFGT
jgi:hypothetical protein